VGFDNRWIIFEWNWFKHLIAEQDVLLIISKLNIRFDELDSCRRLREDLIVGELISITEPIVVESVCSIAVSAACNVNRLFASERIVWGLKLSNGDWSWRL
jgi:hypothetical protein